ncbi:DUF1254 domain-containing protein [Aquibium sp. ELW1220]|uniref:DUF1254 domain-containing protein n=1 Tax=Aquibium sp. ELW1220 TaxID=2976766 RepID=UPI0025B0E3AE|nr:DUF1254 domain-containing protein [Aquibium sp. ELW1220]MDN2583288.1 DUF1254 domain-containing protein [Aquibium sp. ELW1220]
MTRAFHILVLGVVGAAIVHIAILMLLPVLSERDAWARLASQGDLRQPVRLEPSVEGSPVPLADPFFLGGGCRFDLHQHGVLHVTAGAGAPFWSVSVYDRRGYNLYSFNDRTAAGGRLDLAVATSAQLTELRRELPDALARSIFVEVDNPQGIVVVRAFRPDPTFEPVVERFLGSIACEAV